MSGITMKNPAHIRKVSASSAHRPRHSSPRGFLFARRTITVVIRLQLSLSSTDAGSMIPATRFSRCLPICVSTRRAPDTRTRHPNAIFVLLPFPDRDVALVGRAGIVGAGPNEAIVGSLFTNMGDPASDTTERKGRREEVGRDAEREPAGGGVEVHVRRQALTVGNDRGDSIGSSEVTTITRMRRKLFRQDAKQRHTGIAAAIDGVAETWNAFARIEAPDDVSGGII